MRIAGNYNFAATREEVWAALNDPEVLARSIPGCQKLEQVGEHEFESTLKIGLQAVKGTYNGRVRIEDLQPPHHYKLIVDGRGSNGFLKGEGSIDLREDGETTIMDYGGEAQVGGTIASVGQRLLDGAARTLINQSLKALAAQIEARKQGSAHNGARDDQRERSPEPLPSNGMSVPASAPTPREAAAPPPTPAATAPSATQPAAATATVASPTQPAAAPAPAAPAASQPSFERRSIVVPEHERLSEASVVRGVVADFVRERPWFPWVLMAFLIGYLFGRKRG